MSAPTADESRKAALLALSPLDGRYATAVKDIADLFSEYNLFRCRVQVELAWLRHLAALPALRELPPFSPEAERALQAIEQEFSITEAMRIKEIEQQTRHDVKAVEYYLAEKFRAQPSLSAAVPFIHFACTSVDIDNLCQGRLLNEVRHNVLLPLLDELLAPLGALAKDERRHADALAHARTGGVTDHAGQGNHCFLFSPQTAKGGHGGRSG